MKENRLLRLYDRLLDALCANEIERRTQIETEIAFEQEREDWLAAHAPRLVCHD